MKYMASLLWTICYLFILYFCKEYVRIGKKIDSAFSFKQEVMIKSV